VTVFLRSFITLVSKDLRLEWRSRARINATLFFALLTLLLFSFAAGPAHAVQAQNAPGYLWLALLLASVLLLGESLRLELENDSLEALRLLAADAKALFLAKAFTNALFCFLLGVVLIPVTVALYGAEVKLGMPLLVGVVALGTLAIAAPGTLYATIAAQARARDVLLPLLLFPVLVPGLLASVRASALVMQGDPMNQMGSWLVLLGIFDGLYWILCTVMYGRVIEE
jgi:heme exporter protein B